MRILILSLAIAALLGLYLATPVWCITAPDNLVVHHAYRVDSYYESGDLLILVDYTLVYDTLPSESAAEAFAWVVVDNSLQAVRTASPYVYVNSGYGHNLTAFYFAPSENQNLTAAQVKLIGNPLLTWDSYYTTSLYSLQSLPRTDLEIYLLNLADQLEIEWTSYALVDYTPSGARLTDYGERFFSAVIPYFNLTCINLLPGTSLEPTYQPQPELTPGAPWSLASGTIWDLDGVSSLLGVSKSVAIGLVYYLFVGVMLGLICWQLNSNKPALILALPLVVLGNFLGVSLLITVLAGLAALLLIGYKLFYEKTA